MPDTRSPAPRWKRCAVAPIGVGLASAFNLLVPGVGHIAPYMAFHLAAPVVAWFSRSLSCAWLTVLASAVAANVISITPGRSGSLGAAALETGAAFILIQAGFTLSVVLLRRRMEDRELLLEQLRTERDRLFSLFAQAPIAVVTLRGPDLVHDFVSPGGERLAQRPMLGRRMRDVFPELEGDGLLDLAERVYREGVAANLEERPVRYRRDDGSWEERFVDASFTPLRDARGLVEGVLTCAVDVTARVRARQELERTEQQIHRLSEAGLLGIGTWTRERIVGANRRLLEILGLPPGAGVPEGGIDWREVTPPELAEADARGFAELETTGRSAPFERQFLRADGTRVWTLTGAAVLDREPLRGVSFVLDITAQKEAERALQEAHQFEQRLLGIVSHDLRNPLASIRLGVDLLLRSGPSEQQLRTVSRMARSAERMHQLVGGLLDLTRLRAGQQLTITRERDDIHRLVKRAVEEVSIAEPGRITITGQGDGSGEWDTVRVGQALCNLLANALRHSPGGSPVPVQVEGGADQVQVAITSGGEAIPTEQQDSLFEPFRRGSGPGALDGSVGLGLYIARHVARAHGGTIDVSSSPGSGTTLRLILPRRAPSSPAAALRDVG